MAPLAGLVSPILTESAFNLARSFFVAFFTVLQHLLVFLVWEGDFTHLRCGELNDIAGKSSSNKSCEGKDGNNSFFHF